jgi:hypothetical protein
MPPGSWPEPYHLPAVGARAVPTGHRESSRSAGCRAITETTALTRPGVFSRLLEAGAEQATHVREARLTRKRDLTPSSGGCRCAEGGTPDLAWLAHDDQTALDQACDVCLSYTDIVLGIRGRAIGLLARVLYPDLRPDRATQRQRALSVAAPPRTGPVG